MGLSDGKSRMVQAMATAQEKHQAVAVYADADEYESYEVGFIEFVDDNAAVMLCLTPKGEPDGRRVIRIDDVTRVDADNAYTRKLALLYQYRDTVFDADFRPIQDPPDGLSGLLELAKRDGSMVRLVDGNDYGPSGFVTVVGEDYVVVDRVGPNGEPDGQATMLMDGISKVHIGRRQEQILGFLHRYNYGLRKLLEP